MHYIDIRLIACIKIKAKHTGKGLPKECQQYLQCLREGIEK